MKTLPKFLELRPGVAMAHTHDAQELIQRRAAVLQEMADIKLEALWRSNVYRNEQRRKRARKTA